MTFGASAGILISFFAFGSTAFVSVAVTFVAQWILSGTRLALIPGILAGLLVAHYLWQSDAPPGWGYQLVHRLVEIAAVAGAIVPPWWLMDQMADWVNIPQYPNEKWTPPWKRDQARTSKREKEPEQESASGHERNNGRDRTSASNRRRHKYFRQATEQMSPEEAWQVLGLEAGANPDEIREMHHRLMMKLHPDVGGSNYLASKVNEARDVLLGN